MGIIAIRMAWGYCNWHHVEIIVMRMAWGLLPFAWHGGYCNWHHVEIIVMRMT